MSSNDTINTVYAVTAAACLVTSAVMAMNRKPGWGWLAIAAIIIAPSTSNNNAE